MLAPQAMMLRSLTPAGVLVAVVVFASCVGEDPDAPNVVVVDGGGGEGGGPPGCSATERACVGNEMRGCKLDGTGFEVLGTCASDALCQAGIAGGKCVEPACAADEVKCDGNDRVKCRADRAGTEKIETCPSVCVAGKCEDCADGTGDCVGVTPRKCVGNKWQNQTACTGGVVNACYAGTCTDTRIPRWEMPNEATALIRPAKYTVLSTNVVRDDVTKLEWQRGVSAPVTVQGGGRAKYCESLVLDGKQGWHVASAMELFTLVDHGKTGQKIDTTAFLNTPTAQAPIGLVGGENAATSPRVNYDVGVIQPESITGYDYPTRCVRATVPPPTGTRFTVNVAGTEVTDNFTKLVWSKTDSTLTTQSGAAAKCVLPWRVPTVKELFTLYDRSQAAAPYYDKTIWTQNRDVLYASTRDAANVILAIDFMSTIGETKQNYFDAYVRCVK
jgi:hypothetical protein